MVRTVVGTRGMGPGGAPVVSPSGESLQIVSQRCLPVGNHCRLCPRRCLPVGNHCRMAPRRCLPVRITAEWLPEGVPEVAHEKPRGG